MYGIRAWDYDKKEFYIEDNPNHLLAAVKSIGDIFINDFDLYSAGENNMEVSQLLAIKSADGISKKLDTYEMLFRERLINKYYDLENPKVVDGVKIYSIDEDRLKHLILAAKNQSA